MQYKASENNVITNSNSFYINIFAELQGWTVFTVVVVQGSLRTFHGVPSNKGNNLFYL